MSYENSIYFAETWGLVLLVTMFLVGVAYALWPSNKDKFNTAAQAPLMDDPETLDKGEMQ